MIEIIKKQIRELATPDERYNFCREFLQELLLQIIDRCGFSRNLAFVGGTALRVIHDLPRFSEDLDFSLIDDAGFDFQKLITATGRELELHGFRPGFSPGGSKNVLAVFVRFEGLLSALGISKHKKEKISVKIEIDGNPPAGFRTELHLINKNFMFKTLSYDLSSLFAGKLHAVLFRHYRKGRDYYDLFWFLTRRSPVNLAMLAQAIAQTHPGEETITPEKLREMLLALIRKTSFPEIRRDIAPFLGRPEEIGLFVPELFARAVRDYFT